MKDIKTAFCVLVLPFFSPLAFMAYVGYRLVKARKSK